MASDIKRPIQIYNGTDWDKILPEISEDMIKSGWTQSTNGARGYKKYPGGQIHNFGYADVTTNASGIVNTTVALPLAFSNAFVSLTGGIYDVCDSTWTVGDLIMIKVGLGQVKIAVSAAAPTATFRVSFDAWGY